MDLVLLRRRAVDAAAFLFASGATLFGLFWLFWILWTTFRQGLGAINLALFTEMTPPPGSTGGLLNAFYGSAMMIALAVIIGAPLGVAAGTYLAEHGRHSRLAATVSFLNDVLLSAPSIVIGLFVYEIVVRTSGHFSGYAGANPRPIGGVSLMPKKVDDRPSSAIKVCGRTRIRDVGIVQVVDESLGNVAADRGSAGLERARIVHDGKSKTRMKLRLVHKGLSPQIIGGKVRAGFAAPVPVDDGSVNPTAQHVIHLLLHLQEVAGNIADIHVVAKAEPGNQMGVNLGRRSGIEQAADGRFADVRGP